MSDDARAEFLATVGTDKAAMVNELADAVEAAAPSLAPRFSYRMLTFVDGNDLRNWVVAISTTKKAVQLRFLFGTHMTDDAGVLRPGSSTLSSIDYQTREDIDLAVVERYVREAADNHSEFKAKDRL